MMSFLSRSWEERNRKRIHALSATAIALIAIVDWWTKPYVSLGFFYLFPIMFAAAFIPRWAVVAMGAGCAVLAEMFSALSPSLVRLSFETLALVGCGLFVAELMRNRRLTAEAEARLKVLVETSPAAIVTVDESGFIEVANRSAVELLEPRGGQLAGAPISAFLPELHHALYWEDAPRFRTSLRCNGRTGRDEPFTADIWLSTYRQGASRKLAAIIGNVIDDEPAIAHDELSLSARESGVLRLLMEGLGNKEIAARLDVSESTIKNTLQQLFAKTRVRTRSQLVRVALEQFHDDSTPVAPAAPRRRAIAAEARRMLAISRYAS